jgi:hypothetical protein
VTRKILIFIFLWSTVSSAQYLAVEVGGALGFARQNLANGFSTGFSTPLFLKYQVNQGASTYLGVQYAWNGFRSSSILEWTDPLDSSQKQKTIEVADILHSFILAVGFEVNFPVNWQERETRVLKYFYPYFGLDFDFFFITLNRYYVSDISGVPDYLAETFHTGSVLLTPTIGAGIRLGTKILLSKRTFLDLFGRYQADLPEDKMKDVYPNHFIQIGMGLEFMIGYEEVQKQSTPQNK